MAFPVVRGGEDPPFLSGRPFYSAKRRIAGTVDDVHHSGHKRPRYAQHSQFAEPVAFKSVDEPPVTYAPVHRYLSPLPHLPSPEPVGPTAQVMERTASGHSIHPDPTERCGSTELLEDYDAAQRVREHLAAFRRRNPDSKHERILRSIISPRRSRRPNRHQRAQAPSSLEFSSSSAPEEEREYPLDNAALESIFSAANEIFFNGRLSQRVTWDWSHASSARYDARVIGTTALRRAGASTRGFETLIVLSSPILHDPRFSRRLLISTFLHELIHSYLFICCGFRARWCGGHTPGFRDIAAVIDEWAGKESGLYLSWVEADLELFRIGGRGGGGRGEGEDGKTSGVGAGAGGSGRTDGWEKVNVYPCSGMAAERDEYAAAAAAGLGPREVMYFVSGAAPGSGTGGGNQEVVYAGRSCSPGSGVGTGDRGVVHYYNDHEVGDGGGSDIVLWRQRRSCRPVYVCPDNEPPASYVYSDTGPQRP